MNLFAYLFFYFKNILKNLFIYFKLIYFFMFSNYFDVLMLKIIFLKKYY